MTASPANGSSQGAARGSIASAPEWGPRAPMSAPLRVVLELGDAQLEEIARRAAALAQLDLRPPPPSPYLTIPEAAAYLRCKRQRVDDLLSQRRLGRVKEGGRTLIARSELEAYLGEAAPGTSATSSWRKEGSGRSSGTR
jgi:excisionase family DNA binding protein